MSRLIIIAQQKGGTRKTFLTVHLKKFLDAKGLDFTPVDLDYEDDLVPRIFSNAVTLSPDPQELAQGISLLPSFMLRLLGGTENAIVDGGANTGVTWFTLFSQHCPSLQQDLAAKGVKVTLVVPVDGSKKSNDCVAQYKSLWPDATLIVVAIKFYRNQKIELPEHDPALTIDLPLPSALLFSTYRDRAMPIDDIRDSTCSDLTLQKSEAFFYLPTLHQQFEKILPHLLP
jgi:hypothetical protein